MAEITGEMVLRINENDPDMLEIWSLGKRQILWGVVHRDFVDDGVYKWLSEQGEIAVKMVAA